MNDDIVRLRQPGDLGVLEGVAEGVWKEARTRWLCVPVFGQVCLSLADQHYADSDRLSSVAYTYLSVHTNVYVRTYKPINRIWSKADNGSGKQKSARVSALGR